MTSQIIGLGGGGFTMERTPLLDLYILANSPKKNPKICFLPTASGDNSNYIDHFKSAFSNYPCQTTYLNIFSPRITDMEKFILDCDIIYVGGGNSKSMLALWREWGVDKILRKAYEQGIVLAGVSAGFVCWFECCITDSIPNKYTALPCLGLLKGSACPHYDGEIGRPAAYRGLLEKGHVTAGYAADDGVGLHFIDGKLFRTISSRKDASAYYLYQDISSKTVEEIINPEFLGDEINFEKYISSLFVL